ncbi:MAG: dienelactone hydrolase family protein [bacterium]
MVSGNSQEFIYIPADSVMLEGVLSIPQGAQGIVIFAHGSGSSRLSPRNNFVAQVLRNAGLGTLLFDLLTKEEDAIYENRFNIALLAQRLKAATQWLTTQKQAKNISIGYFGASTGVAAALEAAADLGVSIGAVVSRGGRPDLAEQALARVQAPTLLVVGGNDDVVLQLNREALRFIKAKKELCIIPGATHLFEEPGALEEVARLASNWFVNHLTAHQTTD